MKKTKKEKEKKIEQEQKKEGEDLKEPAQFQTYLNQQSDFRFLIGGGIMSDLIRTHEWRNTLLGPVSHWPQSLKTSVSLILNSRHPMFIAWGQEKTFIYNDAYIEVLSLAKHPWALGRPFSEVWAEIWDICEPLTNKVFFEAEATFVDGYCLFMRRLNYIEETYFSFSYSPIRAESGDVQGLFCASAELTDTVLNERRLKTLGELSSKALLEKTIESAYALAAEILSKNQADVPFMLLYSIHFADAEGGEAVLEQATGLSDGIRSVSPNKIDLGQTAEASGVWPIARVVRSLNFEVVTLENLASLPEGLAGQAVTQAIVLPITAFGSDRVTAVLIAGVNPCRKLDVKYQTFFTLVAVQIGAALQSARTYEEEKKRAEALTEIDRAKTKFFSNVSHEFRTPLTLMLGPLEDMLKDQTDPLSIEQRAKTDLIYRNSLRLLKLVNSLLDFSRIEAGRMKVAYQKTDLSTLTADVASVFRSVVEKGGLEFVVDTPALPDDVYVDREMWEKIILNLLSNAFKFTLKGKIKIRLRAKAPPEDHEIELIVTDTGVGIPPADLPHIFDRFHRVEGTHGRTHEGTGIGLALIQELIHLHGGTISATSTEGMGSEFYVTIPRGSLHLMRDSVISEDSSATRSDIGRFYLEEVSHWGTDDGSMSNSSGSRSLSQKTQPSVGKKRGRILLADDNTDMRRYVTSLLAEYWEVEAVGDGQLALERIQVAPPDLILSDVMMPRLDGFELLQFVRTDPKLSSIPFILLSARAGEESRIEGLQTGADDYLVKPFSAKELLVRVQTHLELGRLRSETNRQKEKFLSVLMQAPVGICMLEGPEHIYTLVNSFYLRIHFGGSRRILNKPIRQALPELEGQGVYELLDHVYHTGEPYHGTEYPVRLRQEDGSMKLLHIDFVYEAKRDLDGKIEGILVVGTDVTLRVQERKKVEETERRLQMTLAAARMGTLDWFLNSDQIYLDETAQTLFAVELGTEPISIERFRDLIHAEDIEKYTDPLRRAIQAKADADVPFVGEYRITWPDGTIHWLESMGRVVRDGQGVPLRMIGTVFEITEKKRNEAALQDAIAARDEFLSIASHELKTPVTSLKLHLQMAQRSMDPTRGKGYSVERLVHTIDVSAKQVSRLTRLLEDLLDVSRIQAGKLEFNFEEISLKGIIDDVMERFSTELETAGVTVTQQVPALIFGNWDALRMEQVIVNLISNAIKYAPRQPLSIIAEKTGAEVKICVQDHGPGIAVDQQKNIFERFERATASRNISGLGLGLFIVRKIVECHKGSIHVESAPGHGTTFVIQLPIDPCSSSVHFQQGEDFQ